MSHEERVRRLLAEARHDEPAPPEVVARLDATLADLVAERSPAPVVDLAARRRRRRGSLVLAAAAVVVAGVGLGQAVDRFGGVGAGSGSDSVTSLNADAEPEVAHSDEGAGEDDKAGRKPATSETPLQQYAARSELSATKLRRQLLALRQSSPATDLNGSLLRCAAPDGTLGHPVTYRGEDAVAVFRDPVDGRQAVEIHGCDPARLLRTLTLPAP